MSFRRHLPYGVRDIYIMQQDHLVFDMRLIEHFRIRAFGKRRGGEDFLLQRLADDLGDRLASVDRHFSHALDLHSHTDLGVTSLMSSGKVARVERVETDALFLESRVPFPCSTHIREREKPDFPAHSFDLVTSLGSLHLTNDTPGTLVQIRQILKPDGLFLAALAGAGTLRELRQCLIEAESEIYGGISPRVAPFLDVRDGGALLQRAGFALPVADSETVTVRYGHAFDLFHDLRAMGMQNALIARSRRPVSKRFFSTVAQIYAQRFNDDDGRIRATFNFIWLSGWAPHPNQQKPARRGSATTAFRDILGNLPHSRSLSP